MPQVIKVSNLHEDLQQYMDPDGGTYDEEVGAFTDVVQGLLDSISPRPQYLVLWDDQDGGDPELSLEGFDREQLLGAADSHGMVWNKAGHSYYGATKYTRDWYPVGRFVLSLWFGGSPLNSAPGFYLLVG